MKKFTPLLIFLFCMATAKGQEPAITMTTAKAVGDTIKIGLSADTINTAIQLDFGDGIKVDTIIGTRIIYISGTLVGSQTINIYGSGINVLVCTNNQLTALDVSNNTALKILFCPSNQLTTLDLTNNVALESLNCDSNHLTTLEVSNKPALKELRCTFNQLKTLIVSNNSTLKELFCLYNQITKLEVTNNPALNVLNCSGNKLSTLDVSTNTALVALVCSGNQLTTLDVSTSTDLEWLTCAGNQITTLMLNNSLVRLFCQQNQLTFATLPYPKESWISYSYAPQKPIFIGNKVKVGDDIDLGSQLTVNGNTTVYTWKTKDGTILTEGIDYTISNGITAFLKAPGDSIYCEMTNATFPAFTGDNVLKTTLVKVHTATASSEPGIPGNGVYFYPNPASNFINIDVKGMQNAELSIYNALGMLMLQQSTADGEVRVHIGHLPKGVYMLHISDGIRKIVQKIVKE